MPSIGNQSFNEVVAGENRHYFDKTELIDRIVKDPFQIILFNRPRRFGKSLNMSMLDCYFNLEYKGNKWFDGLKISKIRPNDEMKNGMPVIYVNLQNIKSVDFESFKKKFSFIISSEFRRFQYLEESETADPTLLKSFRNLKENRGDDTDLTLSLLILSEMLYRHHGKSVMILLDEYDRAPNDTCDKNLRDKEVQFLESFLTATFKGNMFLWKGVLMGILPNLGKSSFSGMNNAVVDDIASLNYADMFGFTQEDIDGYLDGR